MYEAQTLNTIVGIATLAMQVIALALFCMYFMRRENADAASTGKSIKSSVERWGLWTGLALTLAALAMALYYSSVLGFEACSLCWWQRIFLFPQAILFAMAIHRGDGNRIADYSIALSIFGLGVALYQHVLQMFPSALPCPATGVSCAQRLLFELGYITFPLVAATLFSLLIVIMLFVRER